MFKKKVGTVRPQNHKKHNHPTHGVELAEERSFRDNLKVCQYLKQYETIDQIVFKIYLQIL